MISWWIGIEVALLRFVGGVVRAAGFVPSDIVWLRGVENVVK